MADVTLPQLGETVTEGTITRWFKNVGDTVRADEPLFEVSTDKVDTEVPSPIAGTLTEIRVQAGDTVPVGTVIAVVGASSGAAAPAPAPVAPAPAVAAPVPAPTPAPAPVAAAPAPAPAPVPKPAPAPAPAPARAPAAALPTNIVLSPVVRRLITDHGIDVAALRGTGPGGRITREDVLDYIDAHGLTRTPAPTSAAVPTPAPAPAPASAPTPAPAPAAVPAPAPAPAPAAAPKPAPAPAPRVVVGARDEVVPLSKIRRLTGSHMVASKSTAPHAFSVVEVDYANVDVARNASKDSFKSAEGFSLTYLPFISRAIVDAIAHFPHMNASLDGDTLVVHKYVDLGIAVDLEYQGLLVPVVRGAEGKRLRAIAREINDLASRARSRKLSPDEIQGGTFTISNNGSAGSVLTMAIINQPQVAIISTDAIVRKPVAVRMPDGSESIAIHPVGNLAMSWDHRAFDGAYAANFLAKVKQILETQDWSAEL
ncbi:MAG: 2-oxo acid dehydrogenase subunit E2 [Actinobacteria bacterium]|nr:2-oxo acid dehydrogenase subunit E2 [Actinomycetota bacterium]